MGKALPLMVQGTSSDAGKSVLVTALCRIFAQDGYATAPFKSQNMALNSYVTPDGKEIGRAQGVQAEAAGIIATTDMNPILIKPSRHNMSQIVVHGKPYENMNAVAYRTDFFPYGYRVIEEAYKQLARQYERIIIEGAGSPAEINLNDRELVNMRIARMANAPVILVADIERGGVFASLVGTLQLLEPQDRDRVIGVVINKFRGDLSLLQSGLDWFEQYAGKPVLGVIPFLPNLHIDAEDSLILDQYKPERESKREIDIAVIRYPRIANFTDLDPFLVEPDCMVRFVTRASDLAEPDLIILPGTKNTIEDLLFLRDSGIEARILELLRTKKTKIFGICGGYQMLGEQIEDPFQVESPVRNISGMGLIPLATSLAQTKTTVLSTGFIQYGAKRIPVKGYEIHMGQSRYTAAIPPLIRLEHRVDGVWDYVRGIFGSYFHGIFHNDEFRSELLNQIRREKGLPPLTERVSYVTLREQAFDLLADNVRAHLKLAYIHEQMKLFQSRKAGV
jgi:adenosylcobyric acid synthase